MHTVCLQSFYEKRRKGGADHIYACIHIYGSGRRAATPPPQWYPPPHLRGGGGVDRGTTLEALALTGTHQRAHRGGGRGLLQDDHNLQNQRAHRGSAHRGTTRSLGPNRNPPAGPQGGERPFAR